MRKSYFIINPDSGNKQGKKLIPRINELWKKADIAYEVYITRDHTDIAVGVSNAILIEATEIIVAGGDGTILAIVNALDGYSISLGIIPCGTGNDFARSNGINLNSEKAISDILDHCITRKINIGKCNGFHFLNVASVGIDAAIVQRTKKVKKWVSGPLAYLISSIIEIIWYTPLEVTLTIEGESYQRTVELVAIANGKYYGGGMMIAPMADSTDGYFDVVMIRSMKKLRLIRLLPTLYSGSHLRESEVEIFKSKRIQIDFSSPQDLNLDGELSRTNHVSIEVEKYNIDIISAL